MIQVAVALGIADGIGMAAQLPLRWGASFAKTGREEAAALPDA